MNIPELSNFKNTNVFLYAAYISTCLEDRAWSFCVSLCMECLGGMRFVSFCQLFESSIQMLLSGPLGKLLDYSTRRNAIITVVLFNNLSILLAAVSLIVRLSINSSSIGYSFFMILSVVFCGINRLFLNAEKSVIGRDWVLVLGNNSTLSRLNATLTTFDQLVNVVAPLATGIIVTWYGLRTTVIIFGIGSLVSLVGKGFFLWRIYNSNKALQYKRMTETKDSESDNSIVKSPKSKNVFQTYFGQASWAAAFGMTLFYKTVMGFDGLAVGYASSVGLPVFVIGVIRSYGSFAGMMGALSYAFFEKRYNVATSGMIGLVAQQTFSLLAVISIWLKGSPMNLSGYFGSITFDSWLNDVEMAFDNSRNNDTSKPDLSINTLNDSHDSVIVFLIAVASARYGLWCIDLAVTHIMQMNTPEHERNTVFGMHMSLCQTFSVPKELLVMIFPQNSTFALYILSSYGFVTAGQLFFVYYLVKSNLFASIGKRISNTDKFSQS